MAGLLVQSGGRAKVESLHRQFPFPLDQSRAEFESRRSDSQKTREADLRVRQEAEENEPTRFRPGILTKPLPIRATYPGRLGGPACAPFPIPQDTLEIVPGYVGLRRDLRSCCDLAKFFLQPRQTPKPQFFYAVDTPSHSFGNLGKRQPFQVA